MKSDKHLIHVCDQLTSEMSMRMTALRVLDGARNPEDSRIEAMAACIAASKFLKHARDLRNRFESRTNRKAKR
jgi:hypothetical protein